MKSKTPLRMLISGLLVGAALVVPGSAQVRFEDSCHVEQLRKWKEQKAAMGADELAKHPELERDEANSHRIIEEGRRLNQEAERMKAELRQRVQNDPGWQEAMRELGVRGDSVDRNNPSQVHRHRKDRDEIFAVAEERALTRILPSETSFDQLNGKIAAEQHVADLAEKEFLVHRLEAGISGKSAAESATAVRNAAVTMLRVAPEAIERLQANESGRQALAAAAVAKAIGETGTLPEELEAAVRTGMAPFDTAGRTLPQVASDGLVADMGFTHLGKWGGTEASVERRQNLTENTRVAVAAMAADVLVRADRVEQFHATLKKNVAKYVEVPAPERPVEPEAPAKTVANLAKALKATLENEVGKLPAFVLP